MNEPTKAQMKKLQAKSSGPLIASPYLSLGGHPAAMDESPLMTNPGQKRHSVWDRMEADERRAEPVLASETVLGSKGHRPDNLPTNLADQHWPTTPTCTARLRLVCAWTRLVSPPVLPLAGTGSTMTHTEIRPATLHRAERLQKSLRNRAGWISLGFW